MGNCHSGYINISKHCTKLLNTDTVPVHSTTYRAGLNLQEFENAELDNTLAKATSIRQIQNEQLP